MRDPFRVIDLLASTWGVLFTVALGLWVWGREDAYALAAIVAGLLLGVLLVWAFAVLWPPVRAWFAERSCGFFVWAGLAAVAAGAAGRARGIADCLIRAC